MRPASHLSFPFIIVIVFLLVIFTTDVMTISVWNSLSCERPGNKSFGAPLSLVSLFSPEHCILFLPSSFHFFSPVGFLPTGFNFFSPVHCFLVSFLLATVHLLSSKPHKVTTMPFFDPVFNDITRLRLHGQAFTFLVKNIILLWKLWQFYPSWVSSDNFVRFVKP